MTQPEDVRLPPPPQPAINLPPVVWGLLVVLSAIHGALYLAGPNWVITAQSLFAFNPARFGTAPFYQVPGSKWWSFLTYGFLHGDWIHLAANSLWLAIFGKPVATRLGAMRFLALVAIATIAGAVASLVVHFGQNVTVIGISGGVSGVLAAALPIMYSRQASFGLGSDIGMDYLKPLTPLQLLTSREAMVFGALWLGLQLFTAASQHLTGTAFLEERVVAWEAHVAGFAAGLVAFYLLDRKKIPRAIVM